MRLMVEFVRAPPFFCFFFCKKIKRQARAKNDVVFIFFKNCCKNTPTAARRHSLVPGFHTVCVKCVFNAVCNLDRFNTFTLTIQHVHITPWEADWRQQHC